MAIGDAYSTAARYRTRIGKTDTSLDADILDDLKAVSRGLEIELGRFFNAGSSEARVYSVREKGLGETERPYLINELMVDDLTAAPTSVKVDEDGDGTFELTLSSVTDYEVLPRNALKEPEARPYTSIRLRWTGAYAAFLTTAVVEVTGVFGWVAVPKAIERATIDLTGILRLETPRATSQVNEGIGAVIGTSHEAQAIVGQLRRRYLRHWGRP